MYAGDLIFLQHTLDFTVQCPGGIQIVAKRLLNHNAPPAPVLLSRKAGSGELLNDMREELGRGRQVKKVIALRMALKIDGVEPLPEFQECVRVRKIAPLVKESLT